MSHSQHILSDSSRVSGGESSSQVGAAISALACDFNFSDFPQAELVTPKRRPVARTRVMAHPYLRRGEALRIARQIKAVSARAEASVAALSSTSCVTMALNDAQSQLKLSPWSPRMTEATNHALHADAHRYLRGGVASAFSFSNTNKENQQ